MNIMNQSWGMVVGISQPIMAGCSSFAAKDEVAKVTEEPPLFVDDAVDLEPVYSM